MNILIAIPTLGSINSELAVFLLREQAQAIREGRHLSVAFETRDDICRARNCIVKTFMESDNDALFMLDADTIPPFGATKALSESGKPITAGVYFRFDAENRQAPIRPVLNGFKGNPQERYGTATRAGGGCMVVRREVFETMKAKGKWPAFSHIYSEDGDKLRPGEDWHFCEMATECGFNITVDTGIICSHAKSLSPEVLIKFLPKPDEMFKEETKP